MTSRKLLFVVAIVLSSCVRKPEQFSTPAGHDKTVIFPWSVGRDLVEIKAQENTYDLDGEVMRALMIAANDYIPPGIHNPPCWARPEALTYRFTRREDIVFVYLDENFAYCGIKPHPIHHGAKYAISKDGRILRRAIDGMDEDDHLWSLKTPDGGTVIVVTESFTIPNPEDLEKPDSGILKIITEPVDMPGVLVWQRHEGWSGPVEESPEFPLGNTASPFDDAGTWGYRDGGLIAVPKEPPPAPASDLDGGTPDAGLSAPPSPPDAGAAAP